jgi:hypothetical protein
MEEGDRGGGGVGSNWETWLVATRCGRGWVWAAGRDMSTVGVGGVRYSLEIGDGDSLTHGATWHCTNQWGQTTFKFKSI